MEIAHRALAWLRAMRRLGIPDRVVCRDLDTDQGVGNIYKDPQDLTELRVVREVVSVEKSIELTFTMSTCSNFMIVLPCRVLMYEAMNDTRKRC